MVVLALVGLGLSLGSKGKDELTQQNWTMGSGYGLALNRHQAIT